MVAVGCIRVGRQGIHAFVMGRCVWSLPLAGLRERLGGMYVRRAIDSAPTNVIGKGRGEGC